MIVSQFDAQNRRLSNGGKSERFLLGRNPSWLSTLFSPTRSLVCPIEAG